MFKKLVLILILLAAPVLADDINMTPQSTFSGFNNNGTRPMYPRLETTHRQIPIDNRADIMKPKSVRELNTSGSTGKAPMTYNQFPQNYDSSNMLHSQGLRNSIQNMFMDY